MKTYIIAAFILIFNIVNLKSQSENANFRIIESKSPLSGTELSLNNSITDLGAKKERDFRFSTNLYLWGTSLSGVTALPVDNPHLSITQTPELDISLSFSDAVKHLKMAFMLGGKFMYKNVGLLYDVGYVKLEFDGSVPVASTYISGSVIAKQLNADFALLYRFPMKNKNVQISGIAGARVFSMDNTINLVKPDSTTGTFSGTKTWADPILGGDARVDFSKHWMLYLKGDVGGFGIVSKFTGSLLWTIGYKFSENWNTNIGFKYLYTDYEKDEFVWKMSQYGMLLSFGYNLR